MESSTRASRPPAARRLWELYETLHDVVYFTPECRAAASGLGLRGFWMGYFALRAAPLGPVACEPVTALFYGFHSDRVARALPDAWIYASPDQALQARERGAAEALRRLCGSLVDDSELLAETVDLAWRAACSIDVAGRPLGGANRAVPRPADPVAALWQACTTLREHRGDGHVAVLVTRGISPVQSHLLKAAAGENEPELLRDARNWPADTWNDTLADLQRRGWLSDITALAPAGHAEHLEIEDLTDRAAAAPWIAIGDDATDRLAELLTPLADAITNSGALPSGNPTGLTRPSRP